MLKPAPKPDLSTLSIDQLAEHFWLLNDQFLFGTRRLDAIEHFGPLRDEWRRRGVDDVTERLEAAAIRLRRWQ